MEIEEGCGGAKLALIEKSCARDRRDSLFKIGIRQHYHRRVPTKLKSDSLQIRGCRLRNEPSHARRAGECDFVYIRMRGQCRTDSVTITRHDIDDAGRESNLFSHLSQTQQAEGCLLRGFDDGRTTCSNRGRQFLGRKHQSKIPRDDFCHDTAWYSHRKRMIYTL